MRKLHGQSRLEEFARRHLCNPKTVRYQDNTGSFGGMVLIVSDEQGRQWVVKTHPKAAQEYEGYQLLFPLYGGHLPEVSLITWEDATFIMYPYVEGAIMKDMVCERSIEPSQALSLCAEIVEFERQVWQNSMAPYDPSSVIRDYRKRATESVSYLMGLTIDGICLQDVRGLFMLVNGSEYPPLDNFCWELVNLDDPPSRSMVISHGDAHVDNIVVDPEGIWYIIDGQAAGYHCWMEALLRPACRWTAEYSELKNALLRVENGRLCLEYEIHLPPVCTQMEALWLELAPWMGAYSSDSRWEPNFRRLKATQFIRRMMYHHLPIYNRAHMKIPMIGASIHSLYA